MGKPLSRPDCLRQNPACVGITEEEDINIEDCYVPQRSIYDTVRLNEQIDSGSKGSLASRHLTERYLPYSQRTLESAPFSSNGALSAPGALELRARESTRLDEKMIFDALKLNSDAIRTAGAPKVKAVVEKRENRRSWRTFVPPFTDYPSRAEASPCESTEAATLSTWSRDKGTSGSLTSEEDSGLSSPSASKAQRYPWANSDKIRYRSLSSVDGVHLTRDHEAKRIGPSVTSGEEQMLSRAPKSVPSITKSEDYGVSPTEEAELIMALELVSEHNAREDTDFEGNENTMEYNVKNCVGKESLDGKSNFISTPAEIMPKFFEAQQADLEEATIEEGKENTLTQETCYWDTVVESQSETQSECDHVQPLVEPDTPLFVPGEIPPVVESMTSECKGYYENTPVMDEVCICSMSALIEHSNVNSSGVFTDKLSE
ncbi:uncharacterized protein LOC125483062 [Rhincodon typus]|uniref:uncharacterized protein LOC125483062 n=1 Tax=Rhincodon typus TaxID=259920 RepID=UPI00202F0FD1|nr:uncharacterized protein LOC125483062 [Rhincodon typus]